MKKDPYVIVDEDVQEYAEQHTSPENEVLQELYRYTNLHVMYPRMLSGHVLGSFLRMVSQMIKAKRILEIGTYTGYSTICLAGGLPEDGELHTIEMNPELEEIIRKFLVKSGYDHKIHLHIGDAMDIIPELNGPFDLVFMDADKKLYADYYVHLFDKVRPGGFILVDNALWDGRVLDPDDRESKAIAAFNDLIQQDQRVENVLLTVRDGVMLVRKKKNIKYKI